MELATLALFCTVLIVCVLLDGEVLCALAAGLALFVGYALKRGFSPRQVLVMCGEGIRGARNVLLNFLLIGVLTAFWRAAGGAGALGGASGAWRNSLISTPNARRSSSVWDSAS